MPMINAKQVIAVLSALVIFSMAITTANIQVYAETVKLTPADNKAKQTIFTNASAAVDHKYSRYDLIIGSVKGDNSTFVIYNKTTNDTIPGPVECGPGTHLNETTGRCDVNPPPEPVCPPNQFYNKTSQQCEDNPNPNPNPTPNATLTKINLAGDYSGTSVIAAMNAKKADMNIALGDMGYKSDLSAFKSAFNKLPGHACIPGNHEQNEDGSAALTKESNAYCGEFWTKKVANGTTLLMAYNTNGNLDVLLGSAQQVVMDNATMQGVKNVVLLSHKPCFDHPQAHHGVEGNVKTFCQSFTAKIPKGVTALYIAAHDHEISHTKDNTKFIAGGGGQTSHRGCGTDATWTFCKEANAFLQLSITNDGKITSKFYNTNGGVIS